MNFHLRRLSHCTTTSDLPCELSRVPLDRYSLSHHLFLPKILPIRCATVDFFGAKHGTRSRSYSTRPKLVDNSCLFLYAFPWFLRRWRTCSLDEAYRISKIITAEQNPIAVPNKIYRACMRGWSLQAVQAWWTRGFERPVVRHSCLRCFRWKLRDNAILGWKLSSSPCRGHCNVLNRGKPFAYIRWIWNLVRRIFSI